MTGARTWTARPDRRRIRRRHATARAVLVIGLGMVAASTVAAAVTTPRPPAPDGGRPAGRASLVAPLVTAGTPAPEVVVRVPTEADPLRVWIAGDSMWETAGPVVAARLEATGAVATSLDVRYSSGLTRPDFFDWPSRAAEVLEADDPELVLVLLGANDGQAITVDGARHDVGSPGFERAYEERTRQLMELLAAGGRQVLWVGQPVMRPAAYDGRMQALAHIHRGVAATVPDVTFVPTRALFADESGAYAPVLADATGEPQPLRGADGIHLSRAGADRLADHLLDRIQQTWNLPAIPEASS